MSSREHDTSTTPSSDESLEFLPSGFSATEEFDEPAAGPSETVPGELRNEPPKKHGFVKRNLPFIIVGGVGAVLVCGLIAKMLAGPPTAPGVEMKDARAQEKSAPQRSAAAQQPQPIQRPATAPAKSELPTPANVSTASTIGVGGSTSAGSLAAPASALGAAGEGQAVAPRSATPAPISSLAGADRPSIAESEGLRGTVDAQRSAIAALTQRVARLEARAPLASQSPQPNLSATKTLARAASTSASRPKVKERSVRNVGARRSAQDRKDVEAAAQLAASGYSVHIVRDNLAWLRNDAGQIRAYAIGEAIPGVGNLSAVDEQAHAVYVGKQKIK